MATEQSGATPGAFQPLPQQLPPVGSPERWPWLRRLCREDHLDLEPWLVAIESHTLRPGGDLLAALAERLDGAAASRLLGWWLAEPEADPDLLTVIGRIRDRRCRNLLRQALPFPGAATDAVNPGGITGRTVHLLPLLGHQRDPEDFAALLGWALAPLALAQRRAALEGLALGLGAWPPQPLQQGLRRLAQDLNPALAAAAVDLLARLPEAQHVLLELASCPLAPVVAQRLQRRLGRPGRPTPEDPS